MKKQAAELKAYALAAMLRSVERNTGELAAILERDNARTFFTMDWGDEGEDVAFCKAKDEKVARRLLTEHIEDICGSVKPGFIIRELACNEVITNG